MPDQKMRSDRIPTLARCIQEILVPGLRARGFDYQRSSRVFRKKAGNCIQIVDIQVGQGTRAEQFTVNLAVYHPRHHLGAGSGADTEIPTSAMCIARIRLGNLADTVKTRLFRPFIKNTDTFLGYVLTQAGDKWWTFSVFEPEVRKSLADVHRLLDNKGFIWLDGTTEQIERTYTHDSQT